MKKIFTSQKYIRVNKTISENRFKRKLAHKKWKRRINKEAYQGKNKDDRKRINTIRREGKNTVTIKAPKNFSFIKYPKEAIEFTNKLEKLYLDRRSTFVNLAYIESLDHSAITVLASIARTFKIRNVRLNGSFPKNLELQRLFIDSDFFKYFMNQPTHKIEYNIGQDNQMFTTKDAKVNPELGLVVMEQASMTIWNKQRTCKGLQRVLLELMQNSNNHANLNEKGVEHWWLSVNNDKDNNKVSFIFVDYGIGIFESLNKKSTKSKWYRWKDNLQDIFYPNATIFEKLIKGDLHKTVTGEDFRGKGLPGIKQVLDRNQISELHIISNNVFANVPEDKYNKMPQHFNGTFVYWELNNQNESSQWIN